MSISLTPELARAVASRVQGGLYTSASELIREALRLFLEAERFRDAQVEGATADSVRERAGARYAATLDLFSFGAALQAEKLRRDEPGITAAQAERRREALAEAMESDEEIRPAPDRLKELKRRAKG